MRPARLKAIRRDFAQAIAQADVTLGLASPGFTKMVEASQGLASRGLEIRDQRERALGDVIAAEAGGDGPQPRLVAAVLASAHRVLYAEGSRRSRAGEPREEIVAFLAAEADRAFDLLEPAFGHYGIRPPWR